MISVIGGIVPQAKEKTSFLKRMDSMAKDISVAGLEALRELLWPLRYREGTERIVKFFGKLMEEGRLWENKDT
jgi:hypothetical protein